MYTEWFIRRKLLEEEQENFLKSGRYTVNDLANMTGAEINRLSAEGRAEAIATLIRGLRIPPQGPDYD